MVKNHNLARHISDVAWGTFIRFNKYKLGWSGKSFLSIGTFEPSSRLCDCGAINHELTLKDRIWTCKECGTTHDRDIQAAKNIKRMALHPENRVRRDTPEFTLAEIGIS